jgi:hypothetical protein
LKSIYLVVFFKEESSVDFGGGACFSTFGLTGAGAGAAAAPSGVQSLPVCFLYSALSSNNDLTSLSICSF